MKIEAIYKHFMFNQVSHLPLVDGENNFRGLISKEKIGMEMADLSLSGMDYEIVPEHLLDFEMTESIKNYFDKNRTITVVNNLSQKIDTWEKPRFLAEISRFQKKEENKVEPKKSNSQEMVANSKDAIYHYMSIILESFPDALYATDKEGQTTFYNEKFEKNVLAKSFFKDSIMFAEKYFRDLNKDFISNYLKNRDYEEEKEEINIPVLQSFVQNLEMIVRVVTLKQSGVINGFLYHIIDPKTKLTLLSEDNNLFPSIDEAFKISSPLEKVLSEIESKYIFHTLKKHHENISHSANTLGIPRSTLQNRMKQLEINEKFQRDLSIPVPRNRRTKEEIDEVKMNQLTESEKDIVVEEVATKKVPTKTSKFSNKKNTKIQVSVKKKKVLKNNPKKKPIPKVKKRKK